MKIILSRKSMDSEWGGSPSPIMPDGSIVTFPIPASKDRLKYSDIKYNKSDSLKSLMDELGVVPNKYNGTCHLDPDLDKHALPREKKWKPAFGQVKQAQTHLENQNVGVGDIFLYFGWFKRTEFRGDKLCFVKGRNKNLHVIYGYLQVGEIHKIYGNENIPEWLKYHPHYSGGRNDIKNNTIYVASEGLSLNPNLPGGGLLRYSDSLLLTKKGESRSKWNLNPELFQGLQITYHSEKSWKEDYFQSASKGQEFVIHADKKVEGWIRSLIVKNKL